MGSQSAIAMGSLPGAVLRIAPDGRIRDLNSWAEQLSAGFQRDTMVVDYLDESGRADLLLRLSGNWTLPEEDCQLEAFIKGRLYRLTLAISAGPDGSRFVQLADITAYRHLSERIAINEQRYRSLFSQNPYAVCSLDLQGRLVETNRCTEELTGYPEQQLCDYHWDNLVDERDRKAARESFEAALEGNPCSYRCRVRSRMGEKALVQVTYIPIVIGGKVTGVFGVARDKTERYRLEESRRLLQACMAQIHDVIIITEMDPLDPPGPRIVYVNEGVERMTGYRPNEVLDNTPRMFQGPDTDRAALRRIRKALERREPIKEVLVNYCKNGVPFWNEVEIVPIPAPGIGGRSYFASVQRDITKTKQREAELRHSQEELRQLTRAQEGVLEQERRRIARDLHDELGQTLTALKLNLGLAVDQMEELSGDHRQHLEATIESVDDAVEKVREISLNLRPPMLDDLGFEAAAEWLLTRWAGRDGLDVKWHSEPAEDGVVKGEVATALYRILQECMTNVSRHSEASVVTIHYRETETSANLEVRDNGGGFDPAVAGNYGSGLVGVRERVVMLGGDLSVESASGKGVRIRVELPLENNLDD
ncbi:PAS domain S-box protein [Marinobacter sp. NFXS11]|uniref:PAS domain-containing sensor histidine kinase n=1 Tax=Marinobacter sp. NFXS11 TaxID=2818432 RepID=UPI0032DE40EB